MENKQKQKKVVKHKKFKWIIAFEFLILFLLIGAVLLYQMKGNDQGLKEDNKAGQENQDIEEKDKELEKLTPQEREALKEQERLQKEAKEREDLIIQADKLTLSYDYDGAIELIQSYQGSEGGYEIYPILVSAIERYKKEKESLVLYGGSYTSVTQINHIFFHSLSLIILRPLTVIMIP